MFLKNKNSKSNGRHLLLSLLPLCKSDKELPLIPIRVDYLALKGGITLKLCDRSPVNDSRWTAEMTAYGAIEILVQQWSLSISFINDSVDQHKKERRCQRENCK